MAKQPLNEEFKRMQRLAGIVTENIDNDIKVNIDGDYVEISGESGDYSGFIEDDGTVTFSVIYDDDTFENEGYEEFTDDNWEDILGPNHVLTKLYNSIGGKVEALGDMVSVTVDSNKLNQPKQGIGLDNLKRAGGNYLSPHVK